MATLAGVFRLYVETVDYVARAPTAKLSWSHWRALDRAHQLLFGYSSFRAPGLTYTRAMHLEIGRLAEAMQDPAARLRRRQWWDTQAAVGTG